MIQIHINPARVEKVLFVSSSDLEEDFDAAAWQAIRPLVKKIDNKLQKIARKILGENEVAARPPSAERVGAAKK